jgi:hypothetical protein
MTSTPPSTDDPLIKKYVEAAVEPYRDRLPAADIEVYEARLYLYYETNPQAVALLDEIRQGQRDAPVVARSGEQSRLDEAALAGALQGKAGGSKGNGR